MCTDDSDACPSPDFPLNSIFIGPIIHDAPPPPSISIQLFISSPISLFPWFSLSKKKKKLTLFYWLVGQKNLSYSLYLLMSYLSFNPAANLVRLFIKMYIQHQITSEFAYPILFSLFRMISIAFQMSFLFSPPYSTVSTERSDI